MKNVNHIYFSTLLSALGVKHGYSSRWFGDMRDAAARRAFLEASGFTSIVTAEQVHGVGIQKVGKEDIGKEIVGVDGLVSTSAPLGVTFADCVPLLAVDKEAGIIGAVHAGWKGTLAGIATYFIQAMVDAGARREHIFVSIGPHIGMCCYNVFEDRASAFRKVFGNDEKIASLIEGQWHIDIGYANYRLLQEAGIDRSHIDAPPVCTSCQVDVFNSFRKDLKDAFGVQLGVIGI